MPGVMGRIDVGFSEKIYMKVYAMKIISYKTAIMPSIQNPKFVALALESVLDLTTEVCSKCKNLLDLVN